MLKTRSDPHPSGIIRQMQLKKLAPILSFFIERRGLSNVTVETKNNNSNVVKLVEGPDDVM